MSSTQHQGQVIDHESESKSPSVGNGMSSENGANDDIAELQRRPPAHQPTIADRLSFAQPIQPSSNGFSFSIRGSDIVSHASTVAFKKIATKDSQNQSDIVSLTATSNDDLESTTAMSESDRGSQIANPKLRTVKIRLAPTRPSDSDSVTSTKHSSTMPTASASSTPYKASPNSSSDSETTPSSSPGSKENNIPSAALAPSQDRPTAGPGLRLVVNAKKLAAVRLKQQGLHRTNGGVIQARAAPRPAAATTTQVTAPPHKKPKEAANRAARRKSSETSSYTSKAAAARAKPFAKGAERNLQVVECLHAMVTEASHRPEFRDLLRWSDDGSFVNCARATWGANSVLLDPLISRHFPESVTFTSIRRRFRGQCGGRW
jgi:hypothetical protein